MPRELVPIKIKIGLKQVNGKMQADYPDFNLLSTVKNSGIDWAYYIDIYGSGMLYDRLSGHKESTEDSPYGQQFGVILIPKEFAIEALNMFKDKVSYINEVELEDFYNNKHAIKSPVNIIDEKILNSINTKISAKIQLDDNDYDALDNEKESPGIVKNKKRYWKDYKKLIDVIIKEI